MVSQLVNCHALAMAVCVWTAVQLTEGALLFSMLYESRMAVYYRILVLISNENSRVIGMMGLIILSLFFF